jgi:hypothetical protein
MPLYLCRFCDYNSKVKKTYYNHLYTHINENNASFDKEELELCKFYHNKKTQIDEIYRKNNKDKIYQKDKEYRQNNKDKKIQYGKEYRQNNKDHISQYNKEYRLRKKLEKEEANILDVYDSD